MLEGVGLAALFIERRPLLIRDFWSLKKEEKGNGGTAGQGRMVCVVVWAHLVCKKLAKSYVARFVVT